MNLQKADLYVLLGELEWKAYDEFNDVSDYIWKSPRLLTHEKALEQQKLAIYFPDGGRTADIRKYYEDKKLDKTFPRLIAVGNLFSVFSVFENYVLLLLQTMQKHYTALPKHKLRRGVASHLEAIKAYGAKPFDAEYYEQVCAAISIRNCLIHAKGLLAAFSRADVLRNQIGQGKFLCSKTRTRRVKQGLSIGSGLVTIEVSELGDQVVITNDYSHLVCFYLRDYFCALCGTLNPNDALRPIPCYMNPRDLAREVPRKGPIV